MQIGTCLSLDRIIVTSTECGKKRILETIATVFAHSIPGLNVDELLESFLEREQLGSTGLGHGIALPHIRFQGAHQPAAVFIKCESGVDFMALDQQAVDLILALIVPLDANEEHLQLLAQTAQLFYQAEFRDKLRNCQHTNQIYQLFNHNEYSQQAA